jgi:TRAP-type C4-dicarboxylate transport system permease small subunit
MAVPLGFSLLMLRLVQSFIRDVRYLRDGKPVFEGSTLFD